MAKAMTDDDTTPITRLQDAREGIDGSQVEAYFNAAESRRSQITASPM